MTDTEKTLNTITVDLLSFIKRAFYMDGSGGISNSYYDWYDHAPWIRENLSENSIDLITQVLALGDLEQ